MSKSLRAKAAARKADRKSRMAPLHAAANAQREYDRTRHAARWNSLRKAERETAAKVVSQ